MKSLSCYLLLLPAVIGPLFAEPEIPTSIAGLPWKKAAKELSEDAFFQADIKQILPGLPPEGKTAVTKCVREMIGGKGVMKTGTVADAILAKELRGKVRPLLPKEDVEILNAFSDDELLGLASGVGPAKEEKLPEKVQIFLDSDPGSGLGGRDRNLIKLGKQATRFRIVPGLSDKENVSFEQDGEEGHYLRHYAFKMKLEARPDGDGLFDADATFKLVRLPGNKVQFQSVNYPNKFVRVDAEGIFVLEEVTDQATATFRLVGK